MNQEDKRQSRREVRFQLAGWLLFIVCALFYLASSLRNHDLLAALGSLVFLIACVVFVIPLLKPNEKRP